MQNNVTFTSSTKYQNRLILRIRLEDPIQLEVKYALELEVILIFLLEYGDNVALQFAGSIFLAELHQCSIHGNRTTNVICSPP